jgi:phospholipase/carboxylesterase
MPGNAFTLAAAGAPLKDARAVVMMLHGRGATAKDILSLTDELGQDDIAYLAPQAPGHSWYPQSFLAPLERNEPFLSRSLATVAAVLSDLAGRGIAPDRVMLLGFSQGGCLALEFVARQARRYGGVAGLSAGLIGPPGVSRDYRGSLTGTPVFIGCSDIDPHIPLDRVHESCRVLSAMNAVVTERIYPGMGHTISQDEIAHVRKLLDSINPVRSA